MRDPLCRELDPLYPVFPLYAKETWGLMPLQMVISTAGGLLVFGDEYKSVVIVDCRKAIYLGWIGKTGPQGSSPGAVGGRSLSLAFSRAVSFPRSSAAKNSPAMQEMQVGSLGWEDPLEKGNDNPLQCSCLGNPMDRGSLQATVHGVAKESDTT